MPAAAPIIAAGILAGAGAAIGGATLIGAVAIGVLTIGVGLLRQALAPGTPSFSARASKRTQTLREPVVSRRWPAGEVVLGTVLTFYESTRNNKFHHMVMVLGDAPQEPWDGIDIVWLDDTPIFPEEIDTDGTVISGPLKGEVERAVRIKKHLGGPDQVADPDLISEIDRLDENFRGRGVAYLYIRIDWNRNLFPNGLPGVRGLCRTNKVLDTRDGVRRWTPNAALVQREYLTDPDMGLGFATGDLDDTQTDASANICDEIVDARPVGQAVVAVDTSDDELDLAVAGTGAPLRIETGDRVEIFTDGTAPGGLSTGTSYYAIVERLIGESFDDDESSTIDLDAADYSGEAATAISEGNVDNVRKSGAGVIHAGLRLAASHADALARTPITITSAGSGQHLVIKTGEPRYAAAGMVESDQAPKDAIEEILSSMAGRLVWSGGKFRILPAAWRTPITPGFDEKDLMGPLTVRPRHSRRDRFNAVRGIFAPQIAVGEPTDYPPVIDSTYVANDNGQRIWQDHDLPWTSRAATAQRLAKIELSRHRREQRVEFPTTLKALRAVPASIVQVSNARRGWSDKTFEVLEQEDLEIDAQGGAGLPVQGVTLRLAELDSTAFDFDPNSEETIKAPQAIPPGGNPFTAIAPSGLTLASGDAELFVKTDGTVVSRILAKWTTEDGFADLSEVQFKRSSASQWEPVGLIKAGEDEVHIWDAEDGISYDVRVRTINAVGVPSAWLEGSHTVAGKTAPPPDVDTFNVTRMADGTRRFSWTATRPADVRAGGGFQIGYGAGSGVTWANMGPLHDGLLSASPFETNELAAGSYTFGIKMVDSSNNESTTAVIIEATLGDPRLREVLESRDEGQLGWPGDIVDAFIAPENVLEAEGVSGSGAGLADTWSALPDTWSALSDTWGGGSTGWDSLPDTWDALPDTWVGIVESKSPITYTTPEIDLGSDVTFTPIVSVEPNANATITMQTGMDADGGATGSFVALDTVTARYVRIRVSDASVSPVIRSIVTLLDADVQIEDYEDIDTSAASAGVFERIATGHFKLATRGDTASITSATIRAFQNAGSGWTWDLLSKTTTITGGSERAAEFKIYKDGVLTDATIDVEIKGPKK